MKHIIYIALLLCPLTMAAQIASDTNQYISSTQGGREGALSLDQCLEMAKQHNRTLQNAALELQYYGERQKEAYTKYFPQISANVTAFYAFDKIIKGDGTLPEELAAMGLPFSQFAGMPVSIRELSSGYGVTLSALEPIYAGGQIHKTNQLAAIQTDICKLQMSLKEKDVLQKVTENYWQIATIRYNLRTIAAAEKQITAVKEYVQDCVDAGVTTRNALLQVKLRQQELASNRLKLENGEHLLLMLLEQQVGSQQAPQTAPQAPQMGGCLKNDSVADKSFDIIVPDEVAPAMLPERADVMAAVEDREELKMSAKGVEAQKLVVAKERGKNMPTIAIGVMGYNTGLGGMSDNAKKYFNTNMKNGLALATVSIPISSWWGGTHAVRQQKLKLREAENTLLDAREQLAIDIESAWCNVTEAYKQIDIAKASVAESEENLRMHTDQYKAGTVTITDLLDAETLNRKSHDQLSSAIATYQIRLADYQRKVK